ncbi:hypothetical protein F2Q68_00022876 [Brassica cretica]|uniref:Uncharacterized protein n=1 Tax=Brassica cretica TaxID=69181 RepID=A0A8S9G2A7_BRACR|nr:hypothetical protein F2Q68_00022876 [Brassica cretica]
MLLCLIGGRWRVVLLLSDMRFSHAPSFTPSLLFKNRRVETQPQKPPPTHQRPPVENKTLNLIPEQKALNRTSEKSPNPTTATSHTEGGGEPLEETTDDPRAA